MDNNGQEEKKCPWGLECDKCRLSIEMAHVVNGLQQKYLMCSFPAAVTILSEINGKTQLPKQGIEIPNLFRG